MVLLIALIVAAARLRSLSGGMLALSCLVSVPLGGIIYMMVGRSGRIAISQAQPHGGSRGAPIGDR